MNLYVLYLLAAFASGLAVGVAVAVASFRWGCFAALKARADRSPKWEAYLLALLPPAAFAVAFLFDQGLSGFASQAFMALAAPAFVGTCLKYSRATVPAA